MDASTAVLRRAPRPLDETTNGHAPGSEQIASTDYPSSEEEGPEGQDVSRDDRTRLRYSTPKQLLEAHMHASERHLFYYLLIFRCLVGAVTCRTVFAPDEHWQSLEIAHRIVFGYGYKTWEWQDARAGTDSSGWGNGPIRSIAYPALFVLPYWVLQKLALDDTILLVRDDAGVYCLGSSYLTRHAPYLPNDLQTIVPSLVQAVLAALTDLFTFKVARKLLNERAAWITVSRLAGGPSALLGPDCLGSCCHSSYRWYCPSIPFIPRHEHSPTRQRLP